jgi:hypothetical protein
MNSILIICIVFAVLIIIFGISYATYKHNMNFAYRNIPSNVIDQNQGQNILFEFNSPNNSSNLAQSFKSLNYEDLSIIDDMSINDIYNSENNENNTITNINNTENQCNLNFSNEEKNAWNKKNEKEIIIEKSQYTMINFFTSSVNDIKLVKLNDADKKLVNNLKALANNIFLASNRTKKIDVIKNYIKYENETSKETKINEISKETEINETDIIVKLIILLSELRQNMVAEYDINNLAIFDELTLFIEYIYRFLDIAYDNNTFENLMIEESEQRSTLRHLQMFYRTCYNCNYSINNPPCEITDGERWLIVSEDLSNRVSNLKKTTNYNKNIIDYNYICCINKILLKVPNKFKDIFKIITNVEFDYAYKLIDKICIEKKENRLIGGKYNKKNINLNVITFNSISLATIVVIILIHSKFFYK